MKLTFLGGAQTVTGSSTLLQAGTSSLLVDCGMFQGSDTDSIVEFPILEKDINYVLLTHAHIDHSGRLPQLFKQGFTGKIICTPATAELCEILLKDSAHIHLMEIERINRKNERAGRPLVSPEFTLEDVEGVLDLIETVEYNREIGLDKHFNVTFTDAGHILGSSSVLVVAIEGTNRKKLVFAGDIGASDRPILQDPQYIEHGDYVIMESTYGDRDQQHRGDITAQLTQIMLTTFKKGGNVVIPAFAVGRTQELLFFLREIYASGDLGEFNEYPVFLDSPMAIEATQIYMKNNRGYYDKESLDLLKSGQSPMEFKQLKISRTADESKQINELTTPCVIISASGMCDAGRIRHHLKYNLWRSQSAIVFIGYQANGTLGRYLLDGAQKVKLFGDEVFVNATIYKTEGMSAHADKSGLLKWIHNFNPKPQRVFVVHGEGSTAIGFAELLTTQGYDAVAPYMGQSFDVLQSTDTVIAKVVNKRSKKVAASQDLWSALFDMGNIVKAVTQQMLEQSSNTMYTKAQALLNDLNALIQKYK